MASAPLPIAIRSGVDAVPRGQPLDQLAAALRVAVELAAPGRAIASSAAGNGPYGPSFDASLTIRSRPSSRRTSAAGFPGSYGRRSAMAGRGRTGH